MAAYTCPGIVYLPIAEAHPPIQLDWAALETNDRVAMKLFQQTVLDCAETLFADIKPPPAHHLQLHHPAKAAYRIRPSG